jgi:hypothetical protein
MGAAPLPKTAEDLRLWVINHPSIDESKAMEEAIAFLKKPPLSRLELIGYRILQQAAASTIDPKIQKILGLKPSSMSLYAGKTLIQGLRWALKFSPAWKAALIRSGAEFDHNMFREE